MLKLDYPEMSPLSQSITRDEVTVEISIYRDGTADWTLEVEDPFGASTAWDVRFETDQAALDAILKVIDKDGIGSLIKLAQTCAG